MKLLDAKTLKDLVRLVIFVIVTTLATGLLVVIIGNLDFSATNTYDAVFTDATGVNKGDDVRIAGVKVGTVKDISIVDRTEAKVTFTVDKGTTLSRSTDAAIKYRNLVGQRYIALSTQVGSSSPLAAGGQIPIGQTTPALDLTVLFNGFKPLFQALSPDDLNKLSYEIIQVFQGEGGTVENLLSSTASLTNSLADRDQLIGQLIDNLNQVLNHLADRDTQLSALIINFRHLLEGLSNDRYAIVNSLSGISRLANTTASLVRGIRPPFVADVKQLRRFATINDRAANKEELDRALQVLPIKLDKVGRTAIYGSWFNFYLCDVQGRVILPGGSAITLGPLSTDADRCHLG